MDKVYCYPDTSILKNKLDIHDKDRLLMAETSLVAVRLYQLYKNPIRGSFDYKHLCRIHHHILQDLYSWAGKTRTVNIAKTNLFCLMQFIPNYAESIFPAYYNDCERAKDRPEEFIHVFTGHYADLNALHPFRDAHVIIGTRLEKPSKINGFALLSPIFLSHAGWREDGAVHINTYYTESQMGLCA